MIKGGMCKIFHPEKGLIIQTNMSANRMFILLPQSQAPSQVQSDQCFNTRTQNLFHLWHRRYGHLSYKGLRTLLYKNMVRGLPQLSASSVTCTDCISTGSNIVTLFQRRVLGEQLRSWNLFMQIFVVRSLLHLIATRGTFCYSLMIIVEKHGCISW